MKTLFNPAFRFVTFWLFSCEKIFIDQLEELSQRSNVWYSCNQHTQMSNHNDKQSPCFIIKQCSYVLNLLTQLSTYLAIIFVELQDIDLCATQFERRERKRKKYQSYSETGFNEKYKCFGHRTCGAEIGATKHRLMFSN